MARVVALILVALIAFVAIECSAQGSMSLAEALLNQIGGKRREDCSNVGGPCQTSYDCCVGYFCLGYAAKCVT